MTTEREPDRDISSPNRASVGGQVAGADHTSPTSNLSDGLGCAVGRPATFGQRVTFNLRLPADLHERVTKEAERRVVGRNLLLTHLIEVGLQHLVEPLPGVES